MNHYAFILGREYLLSLAEIIQLFRAEKKKFKLVTWSEQMAIFESDEITDDLFNRLGGSIKYAKVEKYPYEKADEVVLKLVVDSKPAQGKLNFGFSVYQAVSNVQVKSWQKKVYKLGLSLKQELKKSDVSARFVTSKDAQLSSVVVSKNKLVSDQGVEVLIGVDHEVVWCGETLAVQDFEDFAARDHARPARDDVSGMLPPKLARMMINLAGITIDKKTIVLDPFCGSGTVLQEAALLGAGKVLGSDISNKAEADSNTNLAWLSKQYEIKSKIQIEQVDVLEISKWLPKESVGLVVCEPYLGEPIRERLSKGQMTRRQKELADFYAQALFEISKISKSSTMVVMILPFIDDQRIDLPKSIYKYWELEFPLQGVVDNERNSLDYKRPGQKVGREIVVLRKKK